MKKVALSPDTLRETLLRQGNIETHAGMFMLYWEPYSEGQYYMTGFTIDYGSKRWRRPTLAEADKLLAELMQQHAVDIAKRAFGL